MVAAYHVDLGQYQLTGLTFTGTEVNALGHILVYLSSCLTNVEALHSSISGVF